MQADEAEFEGVSNTLDTPSIMTPNIVMPLQTYKPSFLSMDSTPTADNNNENPKPSNLSSMITKTNGEMPLTSADVKVSRIEDELKQSLSEPRKPTPSPFQKISSTPVFNLDKPVPVIVTDDGITVEVPSTADVVKELEALTNVNPLTLQAKTLTNETNEREASTMNGDNIRYDSPPTINMGNIVSPKKKFLIRSQSHTEPTSPIQNNNNNSQSQKSDNSISNTQNGFDDENSMDDSMNNSFARIPDLHAGTHHSDTHVNNNHQFKSTIDNANDLNIQLRLDHNGLPHSLNKQQTIIMNSINQNKRPYPQANLGTGNPAMTKTGTLIIPQPSLNEVSSSDLSTNVKRQRTVPIPMNTTSMSFRPPFPSSSTSGNASHAIPSTTNNSNSNVGTEDQRKKQIRDSNREAARRCRERRRQYIEQLEGNLEQYKLQIKQVSDKLARVERENTQLRAILSETKILHPSTHLAINDSHIEYTNVIAANSIDHMSDSNHHAESGTIQRNYINRNNL
ncbi:unnamed protein product [Adineta ricciae]|uniref:BZIP domain-containing protein n=1 Tax=Adineta ricciae TaxID=249248 RepID=A0A816AUL9_ADIRI|nr:unnamed protein product [Adineta ricciae]CAF1602182.1 unnamed protein product [Adineta ricciae]